MSDLQTSSRLALAKREVSTSVYLKEWGSAVRGMNRIQEKIQLRRNVRIAKSKRGAALIHK